MIDQSVSETENPLQRLHHIWMLIRIGYVITFKKRVYVSLSISLIRALRHGFWMKCVSSDSDASISHQSHWRVALMIPEIFKFQSFLASWCPRWGRSSRYVLMIFTLFWLWRKIFNRSILYSYDLLDSRNVLNITHMIIGNPMSTICADPFEENQSQIVLSSYQEIRRNSSWVGYSNLIKVSYQDETTIRLSTWIWRRRSLPAWLIIRKKALLSSGNNVRAQGNCSDNLRRGNTFTFILHFLFHYYYSSHPHTWDYLILCFSKTLSRIHGGTRIFV